jgi:hypothetical protein
MVAKQNRRQFSTLEKLFRWANSLGLNEETLPKESLDELMKKFMTHDAYKHQLELCNDSFQQKLYELRTHVHSKHVYCKSLTRALKQLNKGFVDTLREKQNALNVASASA